MSTYVNKHVQNEVYHCKRIMSSLFNNRNFSADKPIKKLTTDITYLPFGPKRLYLSSIMDLHNGEIIAYTISSKQDTKFVLDTLNQIDLPKDVLLHSD